MITTEYVPKPLDKTGGMANKSDQAWRALHVVSLDRPRRETGALGFGRGPVAGFLRT